MRLCLGVKSRFCFGNCQCDFRRNIEPSCLYNNKEASIKANKMDRDELYDKLYTDLSSKEARNYLKKVWAKKENYK